MSKRELRSGYTTGACSAAAAKGATLVLLSNLLGVPVDTNVCTIPFPNGQRHGFYLNSRAFDPKSTEALASVIKDAGDDPDVTHGAEIFARVRPLSTNTQNLWSVSIKGGEGVGLVTKPGLPVQVGEWAINPVPRRMIEWGVKEAVFELGLNERAYPLEVEISVPDGKRLAKKTLNPRLGIVDGISILGTTGIVKPISLEAWTDTILAQLKVAKATGQRYVILSTGRSSEKAHESMFKAPPHAYVMAGDFIGFTCIKAKELGFGSVHLSTQFGKLLKLAMAKPDTNVRHGALDLAVVSSFLKGLFPELDLKRFNTAREFFYALTGQGDLGLRVINRIVSLAQGYLIRLCQVPEVFICLATYEGVIHTVLGPDGNMTLVEYMEILR